MKSARLKSLVRKILNDLACEPIPAHVCELSILLTNDAEIRELNRIYRRKDKATDVLSFSQIEGTDGASSALLGDLVISLDMTAAQAKKYRVTFDRELIRLLIHGLLHLHGYDHEKVSAAQAQRMRRKETELMAKYANVSLRAQAKQSRGGQYIASAERRNPGGE